MSASNLKSQPPQSACDLAKTRRQDFDREPANDELARFVDPATSLVAPLRVVETPREIRLNLWHCPLWFLAMCLAPALAASVWFWRGEAPSKVVALAIAGFPATFLAVAVIFMNRRIRAFNPFCVVDLVNSRLELPRLGLSLSKPEILRFVEFQGWRDVGPPDLAERVRSRELSAIVRNDQGSFSRYQVVIGEGWPVSRFGKRLSEIFCVELIVVKSGWF